MADLKPYTSGYMKPPKHSRFKKGQSGNPNGRPRQVDNPYTTLQKVLSRKISVAGQDRKMTIRDALMRRLRERAIAGNRQALALQQKILNLAAEAFPPEREVPKPLPTILEVIEMSRIDISENPEVIESHNGKR